MPRLTLTLLGGFEARVGVGQPLLLPTKTQALLAYLAVEPGSPPRRETLAALLWGETNRERAQWSLRQAVSGLRRALGKPAGALLASEGSTLSLSASAVSSDVVGFQKLVHRGTVPALEQAAQIYRGDLLAGLDVNESLFEEWLQTERARLRELAVEALGTLLAHQQKASLPERAVQTALRLLTLDPLQEAVHRALMRLYVRQDRRGAALRQYQECVELLARELQAQPEAETQQLYRDILTNVGSASRRGRAPRRTDLQRRPAPLAHGDVGSSGSVLIGRQSELGTLRRALGHAMDGHGRVVVVRGEAGVGKSRLLAELAHEAEQRGCRIVIGRCHESARTLPFGAWVDALRLSGVVQDIDRLPAFGIIWKEELARLFPELGGVTLRRIAGGEDYVRLFESIARLVESLAATQPLVLLLDDLHWADEMSVRLFAFVGRRARARPVLMVATAREEELAVSGAFREVTEELIRHDITEALTVRPLLESDTRALVSALVRRGSHRTRIEELGDQVWAASDGNPFVIVETVRALLEGQRLEGTAPSLPQRVRDVITAQVERLSVKAQRLAVVAAAVQRDFDFALLEHAAGLSRSDTAEGLEELVRRRVLTAVGDQFDFTHQYIREVLYADVLPPHRLALHTAIGEALEALAGTRLDEVADRLAYHFSRADQPAKAATYLVRLADRAARSYALEDVVKCLHEALGYVDRLSGEARDRRRLDVVFRLVHSLAFLGRPSEMLDLLRGEQWRCEQLHDPSVHAPYHFWLSYAHDNLGNLEAAIDHAQRATEEATRCADEATMGKAYWVLASSSHLVGRPLQGIAYGREAVARLERTAEAWWLGEAAWVLALNLDHVGDFVPALEVLERVLEIGKSIRDVRLQTYARWTMGWIHAKCGDRAAAIAACEQAVALAPDPRSQATARGMLGAAYWEGQDYPRAIAVLDETIQQLQELGRTGYKRQLEGFLTAILSECHIHQHEYERAAMLVTSALNLAEKSQWPLAIGYAQRAAGRLALARGQLDEAAACVGEALKTFSGIEARYQVARTHVTLAEIYGRRGDREEALTAVREARRMFEMMQIPGWVVRCDRQAADLTVGQGAQP